MPKISNLPEDTSPTTDDYVAGVDAGPTITKRYLLSRLITLFFANVPTGTTITSLIKKLWGGWVTQSGTWAYLSSTTISGPSADIALMRVGTKIWINQTTDKYFYVIGKSGTTITVTGGSDYTVANATITAGYFSNEETPSGFPAVHNYTPLWTAQGTQPAIGNGTLQGTFRIVGGWCDFDMYFEAGGTTTYGTQNYYWNFPVPENSFYQRTSRNMSFHGGGYFENSGVQGYMSHGGFTSNSAGAGKYTVEYSGTSGQATGVAATGPFTWSSGDYLNFSGRYRLA